MFAVHNNYTYGELLPVYNTVHLNSYSVISFPSVFTLVFYRLATFSFIKDQTYKGSRV